MFNFEDVDLDVEKKQHLRSLNDRQPSDKIERDTVSAARKRMRDFHRIHHVHVDRIRRTMACTTGHNLKKTDFYK